MLISVSKSKNTNVCDSANSRQQISACVAFAIVFIIAICGTSDVRAQSDVDKPKENTTVAKKVRPGDSIPPHKMPEEKYNVEALNLWPFDPYLPRAEAIKVMNPAYRSLWMEALDNAESDLRQELISTIEVVQLAGNDDYSDQAKTFRQMLSPDNHHSVNMALASLLRTMDDRESAKTLFDLLKPQQVELSQIVEPALAKWDFKPIREVWRKRIADARSRRSHFLLAIDGLGETKDIESIEQLLGIVMDTHALPAYRIAASRAAGKIQSDGLIKQATTLAARPKKTVDRICAGSLLLSHDGDDSIKLLQQLAVDPEPTVAGIAWRRLLEIDPKLAVSQAEQCLANSDPVVRSLVVQSLFEVPNLERIDTLTEMMDDRHPDVRKQARSSLHRLAEQNDEFDKRVRAAAMNTCESRLEVFRERIRNQEDRSLKSGWKLFEQAMLLLAALDHKNAASIAIELLEHDRHEVMVTSAWALRKLAVKETLEPMLDRANRVSNAFFDNDYQKQFQLGEMSAMDQVAHMFDLFGEMDYKPAEPLMRKYNDRKRLSLGPNSRAAAANAMGKLFNDNPEPALVEMLEKRMNDIGSDPPEFEEVNLMATIAIGRMKAKSTESSLRQNLGLHALWALREMFNEEFELFAPKPSGITGFNLEPVGDRLKNNGQ